jgi:hypothetical protein
MQILLGLALVVVLALGASSKRFWRLRRTRVGAVLTTGGWLMLGVGMLLGPHGIKFVKLDEWVVIDPLVLICLGWVGLMVGLGADRNLPKMLPGVVKAMVVWDALASVLVVGAAVWWVIQAQANGEMSEPVGWQAWPLALLLGVCTVSWSAEGRSLARSGSDAEGRMTQVLRAGSGASGMLALTIYVLVMGWFVIDGGEVVGSGVAWGMEMFVSMLMALVLGWLGLFLMGLAGRGDGELLVVLLGLVTLVAGAAATMGDSPLFVSLLVGAVLVNGPQKEKGLTRLKRVILESEQPVAMVLMLAAGLLADPTVWRDKGALAWSLVGVILLGRVVVKLLLGRWVAKRSLTRDAGAAHGGQGVLLGMMRQNPLAIAIACGYAISPLGVYTGMALNGGEVLMVLMVAGLLSELGPFVGAWFSLVRGERRVIAEEGSGKGVAS